MNLITRFSVTVSGSEQVSIPRALIRSTVGLEVYTENGENTICSGTLVSENLVMTAAHCVLGYAGIKIIFGPSFENPREIRWAYQVTHPRSANPYIPAHRMDVALVYFHGKTPTGFLPAQMLPSTYTLKEGEEVVVAGYGKTSVDKNDEGSLRFNSLKILNPHYSNLEISLEQTSTAASCPGDSGGPVYVRVNQQYYYWGVANAGFGVEKPCGKYIIYADIRKSEFRSQIKEVQHPMKKFEVQSQ